MNQSVIAAQPDRTKQTSDWNHGHVHGIIAAIIMAGRNGASLFTMHALAKEIIPLDEIVAVASDYPASEIWQYLEFYHIWTPESDAEKEAEPESDYTFGSASEAIAYWSAQGCSGMHDSDVCECRISFPCPRCGEQLTVSGEDMLTMSDTGGLCNSCIASS